MSDEHNVTVYKAISSKEWVTTVYFDGADALVSEVKRKLVRTLTGDSDKIVFLNYHVAERDEGGDGGARRISDADRICMIDDYEDDASSDDYVGEFSSAQPQRFILRYSVRTASDNEIDALRRCD